MKRLLLMLLTMVSGQAQAAAWQFLGASDAGQHYVDAATLKWTDDRASFSIATKVVEQGGEQWLTTLKIACQGNRFAYLSGRHVRNGRALAQFEAPQPEEPISKGSMPDQLHQEYCRPADRKDIAWREVGKSETATVYFDPASVRQHPDRTNFKVNTRVQPFAGKRQTFSSLSFDCDANTFTVLRMSQGANGETEQLFDKPQRAMPTSSTATLGTLAARYCDKTGAAKHVGQSPQETGSGACEKELVKLKSIEAQVQYDFDNNALQCPRAESYLQQLRSISAAVTRLHCEVADLQAYMQTVRQAGCP
jgi:hypothetical protein